MSWASQPKLPDRPWTDGAPPKHLTPDDCDLISQRFASMYGYLWPKDRHTKMHDDWTRILTRLPVTHDDVRRALHKLALSGEKNPPTLPVFLRLLGQTDAAIRAQQQFPPMLPRRKVSPERHRERMREVEKILGRPLDVQ